ncbi:MAG TPA: alpha/beta fold hydrolase [Caulobacteraceae bacterium]|nr:alpha/beta fold hydrolase [Caulobacteraceae bacterium]
MDQERTAPLRPRLWLALGAALMAIGVALAAVTERAGGVSVSDVRFRGPDGTMFSALVYRPKAATPQNPAPGILAVHGYINSRETQSPFAIELARRGYVVLALDQRGHGFSGGAAATKGFGGPEGLSFLRRLPFVDQGRIGLEGHSMGGWAVLAAAAAGPDAYRAMVLEGSSTGAPFAKEGTPAWPRNVEVVYSRFDEFAPLMWGVARAGDIGRSPKLEALFGVAKPVRQGVIYGDIAAGRARRLTQPFATHPGDHLSTAAVADAADWFALTLGAGRLPRSDQIWPLKEAGTGLALLGAGALILGLFDALLGLKLFATLRGPPSAGGQGPRWPLAAFTAFVPALTYFALPLAAPFVRPSALFPQAVSNQLMVWVLGNAALALLAGAWLGERRPIGRRLGLPDWVRAGVLAALVAGAIYALDALAGLAAVDFRFWVVALRPFSARQAVAALSYVIPFTLFVLVAFRGAGALARGGRGDYAWAVAALAGGFAVLTGAQYAFLFATGALPVPAMALNTIVAMQFVPLLAGLAILAVHAWRRTGSFVPGALIGGLLVTWYMVAGTATHVA